MVVEALHFLPSSSPENVDDSAKLWITLSANVYRNVLSAITAHENVKVMVKIAAMVDKQWLT